jgi:hypothetical protein
MPQPLQNGPSVLLFLLKSLRIMHNIFHFFIDNDIDDEQNALV